MDTSTSMLGGKYEKPYVTPDGPHRMWGPM